MPEISRSFGIVVSMYAEEGNPHHRPHLHARYDGFVAVYAFDEIELVAGWLPRRQQRMIERWAARHREELLACWSRLHERRPAFTIEPLRRGR